MKLSNLLAFIALLFCFNALQAQTDSLAHYSIKQLDSIYTQLDKAGKRNQFLPYTLAMLAKANKELDKTDTAYALVLFKVGRSYRFVNNMDSALTYYQAAINIQKIKIPKHRDYAQSLNNLASLHYYMRNYALAEPLHQEALKIRKEVLGDKHIDYALSLNNLSILYLDMGNYASAIPLYHEALKIRKEVFGNKHTEYISSLNSLAGLYAKMGSYALAERLYKEALTIKKEVFGDKHVEYSISLNNLAVLYADMGNYALAAPLYQEALKIRKEVFGDKHVEYALSLNNLANLYFKTGSYALAEPLLQEALKIRKEVFGDKHFEYASSLNNLANLYRDMGDYATSEPLHQEALKIRKEALGDKHFDYASSLNNLAALYFDMGNYALAEPMYQEALKAYKETLGNKHPLYANSLDNLAFLYHRIGNFTLSESMHQEALNIFKEVLGDKNLYYTNSLYNLGLLYCDMRNYPRAQSYFSQQLPLRLDYLEETGSTFGEKAKQDLFKTLASNINKVNAFAAQHRQHDSLLVLIQNGALFTKGYALAGISDLLPLLKTLNDSSLNATYNAWISTKMKLGKAYELTKEEQKNINIDSLQKLADEQEAAIMRGSAALKERLGYNNKRFYYNDLVANIGKNEVAIDFIRFENEKQDTAWYYALVSQQGWAFPKYISLCTESQLSAYTSAAIAPNEASYITKDGDSQALYNLLIKPLEPYLKKKKIIHWSPIGLMNQIALGTLQNDKAKRLGEKMEIHQYGSLKDFIIKKTANGSMGSLNKNVLLVGDIAFDLEETEHLNLAKNEAEEMLYVSRAADIDTSRNATAVLRFSRLAGTKVELENLNTAFSTKKWTIEQLKEKEALEERVREFSGNKTPRILHFATHGFFINAKKQGEDNPLLRSGIALAGANRAWLGKPRIEGVEDGLWTAYEIANIDLSPAELVVLSACETARGQIDPHEGVVGLQRSFKIAGVDNMLLSLWQVPDKETVELMQEFYKYYLNGETPSVSLHKAQEAMRKKYPQPYYWAAFILIE